MQIGFFAVYNMLIAFVVISSAVEGLQATFHSTAIGLHFVAVAHDLWREDRIVITVWEGTFWQWGLWSAG
ncbi:hypothetical protein [Salicibibacter kimchii]|uniref:hypothetical protein n=1 Tax=Salicibibacter kimchii TaxID=2099786 RepID=UPI001D03B8C4|nr:hypothetical protein [Salicibibacter kimchii]